MEFFARTGQKRKIPKVGLGRNGAEQQSGEKTLVPGCYQIKQGKALPLKEAKQPILYVTSPPTRANQVKLRNVTQG